MSGLPRILLLLALSLACTPARLHAISEQYTRVFQLPPWLAFCCADEPPANMPQPKLLPPGKDGRDPPPFETAQKALEFYDITFPQGAMATFDLETRVLMVRNTQVNLDLVEAVVSYAHNQVRGNIATMVTVVEGPAEMIRLANAAASRKADAGEELAMRLRYAKNAEARVRVVGDAFVETIPFLKASTSAMREQAKTSDLRLNAEGKATVTMGTGSGPGLRVELETELDSNNVTFDTNLTLTLQPASQAERQMRVSDPRSGGVAEFPVADVHEFKFVSSLTASSGATRLVGVAKPGGVVEAKQEMLWAVFVTQSVRRMEPVSLDIPPSVRSQEEPSRLPAGLHTAGLRVPEGFKAWLMVESQSLQAWLEKQQIVAIPHVEGAEMEQQGGLLLIVNTSENIGRIAVLVRRLLQKCEKSVSISCHTVESSAAYLRDIVRYYMALPEDGGLLASLLDADGTGKTRVVNSSWLPSHSRGPVVFESVTDHAFLSEFNMAAQEKGSPNVVFQRRLAGLHMKLDPIFGEDDQTIDMKVLHELHFGPPHTRHLRLQDPVSKQPYELPVTEFDVAKTSTNFSLMTGGTKLISLHRPIKKTGSGDVDQDVLWATFLRCEVVPQLVPAAPEVVEKQPEPVEDDGHLETQPFTVPPDFLSSGLGARRITAKEVLIAQGIPFPVGADVIYQRGERLMSVRNTRTNLALVAEFVKSVTVTPRLNLAFTARVLQGPGPLLRQLSSEAERQMSHDAQVEKLLDAMKAGMVREIDTARLHGHSGGPSDTEQGTNHQHLASITLDDKGAATFNTATRFAGLRLQVDPTVGADGYMLGVSLKGEFQSAPPTQHEELLVDAQGRKLTFPLTDFHSAKVESHYTCAPGTARIAAVWKPTRKAKFEKEDVLHVLVITTEVRPGGK